jgi:alpha-glucoside transport system permease protein
VHAAVGVPFAVLLLRGAFATVPPGEVTRQRLDGGEWRAATAVCRARWESLVAVAVLEFVLVWNDLVVGLLLGGPGSRLVTLALLGEARQFATNSATLAAGAVVVTAVPLLLVLVTGRWLIRGLAAGVAR